MDEIVKSRFLTSTYRQVDQILEIEPVRSRHAATKRHAMGTARGRPLRPSIGHHRKVARRYLSGKNRSATASCAGTSGKKLSRWQ